MTNETPVERGSVPETVPPHVRQRRHDDCGPTCMEMCLAAGFGSEAATALELTRRAGTRSIWTIDLAYLLAAYRVPFFYTTIQLGVNKQYASEAFYSKTITKDEERVNKLFDRAAGAGVRVAKESVPLDVLKEFITSKQGYVIILFDKMRLRCLQCDRISLAGCICCRICVPGFIGHYCVLIDYKDGVFSYRDPASWQRVCRATEENVELARRAYGTDEDLLFLLRRGSEFVPPGFDPAEAGVMPDPAIDVAPDTSRVLWPA